MISYVDESKARGYFLVCAAFKTAATAEAKVRRLLLPNQSSLHMKTESDARRKQILNMISELEPTIVVYDATDVPGREPDRRSAALRLLVRDATVGGCQRLVLDRDDAALTRDRQDIIEATREQGCELTYVHTKGIAEPLLIAPDAVAWAFARGGHWRKRVDAMSTLVRVDIVSEARGG